MANYYDNIPQAVATIVSASWGAVCGTHMKADEKQAKVIEFTDQLTRAMAQALMDKMNGK